jgi:hypothetical protein
VWNTALLIGWDEPCGTYDHVPPEPVPPPDPSAPPGECGFAVDRSGYRVHAIVVSPWVEPGSVHNEDLSTLGKGMGPSLIAIARDMGIELPTGLDEPDATLPPREILPLLRDIARHLFPRLAGGAPSP